MIEAGEGDRARRIVFSGDLGSSGRPILHDPAPPPEADYVVMETTYGDRGHRNLPDSLAELYEAIRATFDRGGNVIIPTFALERAQDLLYHLRQGAKTGQLPRYMPVFLDSPMAISATEIFRDHPECLRPELHAAVDKGRDPFAMPNLHFVRDASESMKLNSIDGGAVILAGSGMCTGGRVRHHLKHNLWRPESSIVFVGFAARGTPAREIIDGAKKVRLFGHPVQVRASIHTINGFSAHADQAELLDWFAHAGAPRTTFLVHGEPDGGMAGMTRELERKRLRVHCPALHDSVDLA